jgi:hypothetical protein
VSEEGEVRFGRILAAELKISGKTCRHFEFKDAEGLESFYDAEGNSLSGVSAGAGAVSAGFRPAFRVTLPPILNRIRATRALTYAAAPGTPVMAAGNGTVVQAGWSEWLRQPDRAASYQRDYYPLRHLRDSPAAFVRRASLAGPGDRVVGSTAWPPVPISTMSFGVNGVAKDARRIDLGNGEPVGKPIGLPSSRCVSLSPLSCIAAPRPGGGRRSNRFDHRSVGLLDRCPSVPPV